MSGQIADAGFRDGYHPAGRTAAAKFSDRQRKRALKGVAKRRALATGKKPQRRERTRELALARAYRQIMQTSRIQLEQMFRAWCFTNGVRFNRAGFETVDDVHRWGFTRYRVDGQDFEAKNEDVVAALARYGRPRSKRTVQYARRRLQAMGLFNFEHIKRGTWQPGRGWRPGKKKDTFRVTVLHVRRPCQLIAPSLRERGPQPFQASAPRSDGKNKSPPAMPARDKRPPPCQAAAAIEGAPEMNELPRQPQGERVVVRDPIVGVLDAVGVEKLIAMQEMKLAAGWRPGPIQARLAQLRGYRRLLRPPAPSATSPPEPLPAARMGSSG